MSILGIRMAEAKLRAKYIMNATKKDLIGCIMRYHVAEDNKSLEGYADRRCKICGEHLVPDLWEPVEKIESNCEHETIGHHYDGKNKTVNRFPQKCKKCGVDLKPKKWKSVRDL